MFYVFVISLLDLKLYCLLFEEEEVKCVNHYVLIQKLPEIRESSQKLRHYFLIEILPKSNTVQKQMQDRYWARTQMQESEKRKVCNGHFLWMRCLSRQCCMKEIKVIGVMVLLQLLHI